MWSKQPCTEEVLSSSSKSYTSNSSSSSSIFQPVTRRSRTMDEVWNNITWNNITTLNHHNHQYTYTQNPMGGACHQSSSSNIRGVILQDFLEVPLLKETSTAHHPVLLSSTPVLNSRGKGLLPPATVLSLNSAGFDMFPSNNSNNYQPSNGNDDDPHGNPTNLTHSPFMPTTPLADAAGMISFYGKKSLPEQVLSGGDCGGGDRRHKRMIKNRESAARSRARKQAYTNELEAEVNHLNEENNRLRRQYEEMKMALSAQTPIKKKLLRTSSGPF